MKYCSVCGSLTVRKIPEGDNRERDCCENCGTIHYSNPKIIVGTIPSKDSAVLLCKRGIEPRYGKWTLPGGFLENGETVAQGAFRETLEETNTEVEMEDLYAIFNVPQINQVYMLYRANVVSNDYAPTSESLEVQFFEEDEIPWDELAFPFVPIVLKNFFSDLEKDEFPLTTHTIERKK
tara:strand:+ start:3235 stop:3771 length:537 start_codon:yes stop_codon:yes gene_type:complete